MQNNEPVPTGSFVSISVLKICPWQKGIDLCLWNSLLSRVKGRAEYAEQ